MHPLLVLIDTIFNVYFWVVIAAVVMSWLLAFNGINGHNNFVRQVHYALRRLTDPVLNPIRRMLPDLGGLDVSPIVLLLGLQFLRQTVGYYGQTIL